MKRYHVHFNISDAQHAMKVWASSEHTARHIAATQLGAKLKHPVSIESICSVKVLED